MKLMTLNVFDNNLLYKTVILSLYLYLNGNCGLNDS